MGYIQPPLFSAPSSGWTAPKINELPTWPEYGRVAIDVETRDDRLKELGPGIRRGGYIVGYSFAIEGGPAHYVPIAHASGGNVDDPVQAMAYLRDQCARFRGDVVGANLQYDLDYLMEAGVAFPVTKGFKDIQVADPLIWELHDSYSLDNIAKRRGFAGKNETELLAIAKEWKVDPKKELWKLPAHAVGVYATSDVTLPLEILRLQEQDIEKQELGGVWKLESDLLPVLLKMRRRGVRIDFAKLDEIESMAIKQAYAACEEIRARTNRRLAPTDVTAASAIAPILESLGIQVGVTAAGQASVDKAILKQANHPVAQALLRARKYQKLRTTYVASIRKHATNGRIHATFNQLRGASAYGTDDNEAGARFGRGSSSDPNLQNQPARDPEIGKLWRSIYLPEDGALWAANDYSQQEPRVLTHYAESVGCTGAAEFAKHYRDDPLFDTYDGLCGRIRPGDWTTDAKKKKEFRGDVKIIYLGLSYGMGGPKTCGMLNLPTVWVPDKNTGQLREMAGPEGQALIDSFHAGVPFVRELSYKCQDAVRERGYIKMLSGRRCHFPEKPEHLRRDARDRYDWLHKALNRLIQGSSADQTKQAMVDIDRSGHFMQLQVHDEIDGSVENKEEAEQIAGIMRTSIRLRVPMRVDTEIGTSWGGSM